MKHVVQTALALTAAALFVWCLFRFVGVSSSYALTVTGRLPGDALPHSLNLGGLMGLMIVSGRVLSRHLPAVWG